MECRTVCIGDMLDIYSAGSLAELLRQVLRAPGGLVADLGESEYLHTAALQVLLAARRQCEAEGREFGLIGVSPSVRRHLELAGLVEGFLSGHQMPNEASQ